MIWIAGQRHFLQLRPVRISRRKANVEIPRFSSSPASLKSHERPVAPPNSGPSQAGDSPPSQHAELSFLRSRFNSLDLNSLRLLLKKQTGALYSQAAGSLSELGGRLNKITGYEQIESLKRQVVENEKAIAVTRKAARDAKIAYETAVARRSESQNEINAFLQRKSHWTQADVTRLPVLVQQDHLHEQEEARAKALVAETEAKVETQFNELLRSILNRYHEEQVWSDKIRSVSTYGSLLVLSVNIAVFILAIIVVEPWKRKRLAETFEKRIEQMSLENRQILQKSMDDIAAQLEAQKLIFLTNMSPTDGAPVDHEKSESEGGSDRESLTIVDRIGGMGGDVWIVGAIGAASGAILTILFGYSFR